MKILRDVGSTKMQQLKTLSKNEPRMFFVDKIAMRHEFLPFLYTVFDSLNIFVSTVMCYNVFAFE